MPSGPCSLERTADGSQTVFSSQFDAHYHSVHGALQESKHVFIQEGIEYYHRSDSSNHISVLEYGMGTALNVALTLQYAHKENIVVDFHTMEAFPISSEIYSQLDYFEGRDREDQIRLHELSWNIKHDVSPRFSLFKDEISFEDFRSEQMFDVIYFDAFAPSCQPNLWKEEILKVAYESLNKKGILVTFCAKGSFKRALKSVGFIVERVPGPPGKREMTRATRLN